MLLRDKEEGIMKKSLGVGFTKKMTGITIGESAGGLTFSFLRGYAHNFTP